MSKDLRASCVNWCVVGPWQLALERNGLTVGAPEFFTENPTRKITENGTSR